MYMEKLTYNFQNQYIVWKNDDVKIKENRQKDKSVTKERKSIWQCISMKSTNQERLQNFQ